MQKQTNKQTNNNKKTYVKFDNIIQKLACVKEKKQQAPLQERPVFIINNSMDTTDISPNKKVRNLLPIPHGIQKGGGKHTYKSHQKPQTACEAAVACWKENMFLT